MEENERTKRGHKRAATTIDVEATGAESIRLTRCYFECPRCLAVKPAQDFGLRLDGSCLRNQSHCRLCRADQVNEQRRAATPPHPFEGSAGGGIPKADG